MTQDEDRNIQKKSYLRILEGVRLNLSSSGGLAELIINKAANGVN